MILRNTLRALALVICLCAAPMARALPPTDIGPVITMLQAKLVSMFSQPGDAALVARSQAMIKNYLAMRYPQNASANLNGAFIENLRMRMASLTQVDVNLLRGLAPGKLKESLDDLLDSVAFYTLATDAILQRPPGSQTAEWERLADSSPRDWRTAAHPSNPFAEWSQISQRYMAWKQQRRADQDVPYRSLVADPAAPADVAAAKVQQAANAALPRAEWVRRFEDHLREVYGQLGIVPPPGLLRDVAQLQYLMAGLTEEAGVVVPAAMAALRQIDGELAATGRSLPEMLRNWEQLRGFGGDPLMPTGILPPRDFIAMIEAGYIVLDVGTGIEHGTYAHSLQINILMRDFDMHPENYTRTPIELITAIGAFDARILQGPYFAMERPEPLWERVLDVPMPNALLDVLARPESIRDVCRARAASLPNLMQALDRVYQERLDKGAEHFAKWRAVWNKPSALAKAFPELDAATIARLRTDHATLLSAALNQPAIAAIIARSMGERLYQAMTFANARATQYHPAKIADAAGVKRSANILARGPDVLRREPVAQEIASEQAHRDELIRQRQPVPSAPDDDDNDIADAEPSAPPEDQVAAAVANDDDDASDEFGKAPLLDKNFEDFDGGLAALLDSAPMVDLPDYVFPASPDVDLKDEVAASSADAAREKDKKDGKDGQRAESSDGKGKQAEMEPAQ